MSVFDDPELDLEKRLNGQTARIEWTELQRYYARGVVREVTRGLDLIEVGRAIIDNNKEQVETWIETARLRVPQDDRAREWLADNAQLWALVIAPWVLVQEVSPDEAIT